MGSKYLQAVLHIFLVCVIVCVKSENVISDCGVDEEEEVASRKCNLFRGEWVYDSELNPFYDSSTCPFINSFDCIKFGRTDKQYLKYSWKPTSCKLPRFDGKDLLNRWRGKKIMFVGDSIILDQWTSLACMLHAAVPKSNTTFVRQDPISYVKFEEYAATDLSTTLSQLRKDAHPSRYTEGHEGSDCTHWCLPGLPDTWNQLFYATLL